MHQDAAHFRTSVIDVLEGFLAGEMTPHRVSKLSKGELDELAERLNEFYEAWDPPEIDADEFRVYFGGWVTPNHDEAVSRSYFNSTYPRGPDFIYSSLLYANSVVIHDPFNMWFDRRIRRLIEPPPIVYRGLNERSSEVSVLLGTNYYTTRETPDQTRDLLGKHVAVLAGLQDLVREGALILVPPTRFIESHQQGILSTTRYDLRDPQFVQLVDNPIDLKPLRHDNNRGEVEAHVQGTSFASQLEAVRKRAQDPSYNLNKIVAIAAGSTSRYCAPAATDWALFNYRLTSLQIELTRKTDIHLDVTTAITQPALPFLGELTPQLLLDIRSDERAFADWRAELRNAVRIVESSHQEGSAFLDEARQVLDDALQPMATEVRSALARSSTLGQLPQRIFSFTLQSAGLAAATNVAGLPMEAALVGAGVSALSQLVQAAVFRPTPTGAKAVLMRVMPENY